MLEQSVVARVKQLKGIRVLLVEDEPDMIVLFTYVLEDNGATVFAATNAQEALQLLDKERSQILVCNLRLPGLNGKQLLEQIRLKPDPAISRIPAIAITSYSREYGAETALSAGFDRFLAKPIEADHLVEAILQLVG